MAKHTVVTLTSDLSGKPIEDDDGGGTTSLSLGGRMVEIDLTGQELEKLEKTLSQYFDKGRRVRGEARGRASTKPTAGKRDKSDLAEIRTWARANGWPSLGDRGRISQEVETAFVRANS